MAMRKRTALAVGLACLLAVCAWRAINYLRGASGEAEASGSMAGQTVSSPAIDDGKRSGVMPGHEGQSHASELTNLDIEIITDEVVDDLAREALDVLRARELPKPSTVEEVTVAWLGGPRLSQAIHGEVAGVDEINQMLGPDEKPLRIYARARSGEDGVHQRRHRGPV